MIPECLSGKEELNTVYSLNSKSPFERRNAHDVVHTRGVKRCPIAQNMIQESHNGNRSINPDEARSLWECKIFVLLGSHPVVHSVGDSGAV